MIIEQDLTTKQTSKGGLVGRLQARLKRTGSQEWEQPWRHPIKNKIVNAGLARMAYLSGGATLVSFKYGAIGIGATAATDTDTALESQILTRIKSTFTTDTTAATGDTGKWVTPFTSDTTSYAVTEYATCETASGVPILNHVTFAAITLNLNDVLEFTYTLQIQEA